MEPPKTIREQITSKLRKELQNGELAPGQSLREIEFAKRFGVSRGPIRDAFLQLSQEGYLDYAANRGVTVRSAPDPADRQFISSLRAQIEEHVILKGLQDVTENSIADVEAALGHLQVACEQRSSTEVARYDVSFHEAIMIACGGAEMVQVYRQLSSRMLMMYSRLAGFPDIYLEHKKIFEAFKRRDKQATIEALKANIK